MFSTTLSQTGLHVLSYLNDLATGNIKGNVRKYYKDYLRYRKNLISKFINRNIDTNTLQRRINTIIEVNRQEALRNLRKHLANKNYTGTENINRELRKSEMLLEKIKSLLQKIFFSKKIFYFKKTLFFPKMKNFYKIFDFIKKMQFLSYK